MKKDNIVCSYTYGDIHFRIEKIPYGKIIKYAFYHENRKLVRFDTEEKARMYADAFQEGLEAYSNYQYQKEKKI